MNDIMSPSKASKLGKISLYTMKRLLPKLSGGLVLSIVLLRMVAQYFGLKASAFQQSTNCALRERNDMYLQTSLSRASVEIVNKLSVGQALESVHLRSKNGKYELLLDQSGLLSLINLNTGEEHFSSNTALHWPVEYHVELTSQGVLELTWTSDVDTPKSGRPWTSALLPNCDGLNSKHSPQLEIHDSGLLQIRSGDKTICTLHRALDDPGRLAIVYAGFLRTYLYTCTDHRKKLVDSWLGSGGVDVHIYAYIEETFHLDSDHPSKEEIEYSLRNCFGTSLKTVSLVNIKDVSETWDDPPQSISTKCRKRKLDRHISQWKTIWRAGQQVQEYSIRARVRYDYILKTRLDLLLHGHIPALSTLVPLVRMGAIVAPRVALDWTWYCMQHDSELIAGVTDIMAFGKAAQMWTYMNFYQGFRSMLLAQSAPAVLRHGIRPESQTAAPWQSFATHGHSKMNVTDMEPCAPEAELAYWLGINNIPVKTHWKFEMGLLRNSIEGPRLGKEHGKVLFTCPDQSRKYMCPWK